MSSSSSSSRLSVSIIIPSFNRADLLPRAIDSLLNQTRRPNQIVVVDDASTDNTSEVLASYHDEILAVKHQVNRGLSGARNTGIQHVSGEVIAFLDSDDTLLPTNIEKRLSLLESLPDVSVVYSDVMLVDEQGKALARYSELEPRSQPSGDVFHELILHNLMPVHGFMFRRSCLDKVGGFDIQVPQLADYDFWLRMASHYQFLYLDEPLAYYYIHGNMMTRVEQPEMQRTWLEVHRRMFDMEAFSKLTPYQKSRAYSTHGTRYAQQGDIRQARRWYRSALTAAPFSLRPYVLLLLTMLGKDGFDWVVKRFRGVRRRTAEQVFG